MDSAAHTLSIAIRAATADDQLAVKTLVRSEHLNPLDLDWRRFTVAFDDSGLVGAVQLRKHWDGSRELGSLVVRRDARHHGVASQLIDATALVRNRSRVHHHASGRTPPTTPAGDSAASSPMQPRRRSGGTTCSGATPAASCRCSRAVARRSSSFSTATPASRRPATAAAPPGPRFRCTAGARRSAEASPVVVLPSFAVREVIT